MSGAARWWLLSDLHLGVSDDDPRRPGSKLPEFLRREVLAAPGAPQHIAFVGDTFELVGFAEDESLARLESILARHPDAFSALEACAAGGVQLHFVCGNHDVELARPAVAARLSALLSPGAPSRVKCTRGSCMCPTCSWPSTGTSTTRCTGCQRCSARRLTAPTS